MIRENNKRKPFAKANGFLLFQNQILKKPIQKGCH